MAACSVQQGPTWIIAGPRPPPTALSAQKEGTKVWLGARRASTAWLATTARESGKQRVRPRVPEEGTAARELSRALRALRASLALLPVPKRNPLHAKTARWGSTRTGPQAQSACPVGAAPEPRARDNPFVCHAKRGLPLMRRHEAAVNALSGSRRSRQRHRVLSASVATMREVTKRDATRVLRESTAWLMNCRGELGG